MKVVRVLDLKLMLVTVFFVKFHFIDETTTKKKRKNMYFQWDQVEIWWKVDGNFHL